jgi:hypothetical protein
MASIPKYNHRLHNASKDFKQIKSARLEMRYWVKSKMRTYIKSNRNVNKVQLKKIIADHIDVENHTFSHHELLEGLNAYRVYR